MQDQPPPLPPSQLPDDSATSGSHGSLHGLKLSHTVAVPVDQVPTETLLRASLAVALSQSEGPLVLAVSGGRDSMSLLYAMVRWAPARLAAVATYDHATGGYATDAAALVAAEGRKLGLTVVRERARSTGTSEAAWRDARWSFLNRVARAYKARVATAHTRDDQVETVVMRLLRGAGARGLAALAAPSPVVRPWLAVSRAEVAAWASAEKLPYLDDPTNATVHFLRGRMRHDLLPLLEGSSAGFADAMIRVGERAARWRIELDAYVDTLGVTHVAPGIVRVPAAPLEATTDDGRAVLWSALFARAGVALDARGTHALVRFTNGGRRGAHIALGGGAVALRLGVHGVDVFELRRAPDARRALPDSWASEASRESGRQSNNEVDALPARWGAWRFRRSTNGAVVGPTAQQTHSASDAWWCAISAEASVSIRRWQPGDRIRTAGARAGRRVTRYFAEAGVPALDRPSWPVVLQREEIVWVPGVCRSAAAPNRPGRPDVIWYRCERERD